MKTKTCIFAILLAGGLSNNHAQDTWTQKADFGGTARNKAAGFSIGSTGYIGTGDDGILKKDFWEYDPATNTWTQKANFGGTGRANAAGFSIGSTGYIGDGYNGTYINEFWAYNSATNVWTQKAFVGTPRQYEVGFSIGSKGYIGTGYDGIAPFTKDFWEYDPDTNTWTQKADFGGTGRALAVGFSIGSKGYIGTGNDPTVITKDFWEYDPSTNTWTQKADFGGTARDWAVGFPIGNKGYIGTGYDLSGVTKDFWEYDPVTDMWTQKADFGGTARGRAVGFSIGSKGYIGTGADSADGLLRDFWEYTPATAQTNPVPLISQPLVPDAIAPGGTGFTLTVNGTGFVSGSVVNWNGSARATTFVSNSQLTVSILVSDIAIASTASVTVVNPSPGGGGSNAVFFPITISTASFFFNRTDIPAGSSPQYPATADLNGDGKLDLAVANFSSNTVSVLLGIGDGTFQPPVAYSTGTEPLGVTIRDLNQDGIPDLIVASSGDDMVSILLGNGDGTFQNQMNFPVGNDPQYAISADFNADGKLDLAVADQDCTNGCGPGTVSILLGNGDGTFQAATRAASSPGANFVTTGDFNGDAKLDLAVAAGSGSGGTTVSVLLGNGDGTFQDPVDYTTALNPAAVETADFNGDGKLDLAVVNFFGPTVSILLGNGDGTFQPQVGYMTGLSPNRNFSIADLNGDGTLDLAISNTASNTVSTLSGKGNGTFRNQVQFAIGTNPNGVVSGDFNGDGRLDLASANFDDNTISILLQATTVTLSSTSLTFGVQLVGTRSAAQTAILTNTGAATLTISSIAASGDFIAQNNCGSSLPAGGSCTIKVAFKPSVKGVQTGSVTITDDAANSPQTIALTGTGTVVQLAPSALNFGDQVVRTTSDPLTATVTNIGSEDLHISGVGISGANFGDFAETTTCQSRLPAGGSCRIDVTFTPRARGDRHASLKIVDDGGASPQAVPLAGTGVRR